MIAKVNCPRLGIERDCTDEVELKKKKKKHTKPMAKSFAPIVIILEYHFKAVY